MFHPATCLVGTTTCPAIGQEIAPIPRRTTISRVIPMCVSDMCTTGEVVTTGTFLVNQHPIVVLFDSGASHSFISQTFVSKLNQRVVTVDKGSYYISAAGNQISTNQIVRDVRISISNREYTIDLVVLPGLGIDVILGMRWMCGHGVLIDTSTRVVMLREPDSKNAFLVPLPRDFDL